MAHVPLGIVAFAGLGTATVPARADWEYTRWGMTPGQVAAVASGNATVLDLTTPRAADQEFAVRVLAPHVIGGLPYLAHFLFDDDHRLRAVSLQPARQTTCNDALAYLHNTKGRPVTTDRQILGLAMVWRDVPARHRVIYLQFGDVGDPVCTVTFRPL